MRWLILAAMMLPGCPRSAFATGVVDGTAHLAGSYMAVSLGAKVLHADEETRLMLGGMVFALGLFKELTDRPGDIGDGICDAIGCTLAVIEF